MRLTPEDRLGVSSEDSPPPQKPKKVSPPPPPPPRPPRGEKKRSRSFWFLKWFSILFIWGIFFGGCFVLWYGYDLPDISKLQQTERRPSVTVLAKDGTKLATYGDLHTEMVNVKKLPPHVVQAVLAIEDHRFYSHFGVDVIGLMRAIWTNYRAGHVVQGGSTITQQLAKNFLQAEHLYDINDRSLRRKIQEALLALWLERKFTKDQILTIYLNRVYLGSGTYGLPAAAYHYFGKKPKDLSLYEAAVIAGLLKAPTKYSPSRNPNLADQRASQVLENMAKEGFISEEAKEAAQLMVTVMPETFKGTEVRYFTDWVVDVLAGYIQDQDKDLIVTTTLDPRLQLLAENKLQETLKEKAETAKVTQLSLVSMDYSGAIQALVGGANYRKSQFNRATQALRQTGSTFKAIIYLAALERGFTPTTMVSDLPIRMGTWAPRNYKYEARGEIPLQDALAYSVNTVTVRLARAVGYNHIIQTARSLGFKSNFQHDLTIALGTAEATLVDVTAAYATIARGGVKVTPYGILKITDHRGNVLYSYHTPPPEQVVDPYVAQQFTHMLQGVMNYGTGARSALPWLSAGKTGTSQEHRDAWLIGFTQDRITGTWAGNDDNQPMNPKGGSPAARLWHLFMVQLPPIARPVIATPSVPVDTSSPSPVTSPSPPVKQEENSYENGLLGDFIDNLFGG